MTTQTNIIKQACSELGITQKELAERLGASEGTVRQWSSKGTPKWAELFIKTILEKHDLEKELKASREFKENLKKFLNE